MAPKTKRKATPNKESTTDNASDPKKKKATPPRQAQPQSQVIDIDYDKLAAAMLRQMDPGQLATLQTQNSCGEEEEATSGATLETDNTVRSSRSTNTQQQPDNASGTQSGTSSSQSVASDSGQGQKNPVMALLENLFTSKGECVGHDPSKKAMGQIDLSAGIPLGAGVSERVKNKIWGEEYIDLKILLPSYTEDPVAVNITAGSLSINQGQGQTQKQPLSIDQWTTCFNTFIAIYIMKSQDEAANLLKYAATVREMAVNHGDVAWRQYDESFRRLRLAHRPPWQKPIDELYTKAANQRSFRGQTQQPAKRSQNGQRPFRPKAARRQAPWLNLQPTVVPAELQRL